MEDDSHVYVLGAGMSVESGVPAMNGLTKAVLSEKYMIGATNILSHFCGFAFPNLDVNMDMDGIVTAGSNFFLNVEEFMSSLDAFRTYSEVTGTWKGLLISPERIMPLFLHTLARTIQEMSPDESPQYYRNFASKLRPGDTVITLNWDCLLEKACDAVGVKWAYPQLQITGGQSHGIVDDQVVNIVKLHGSVDWRLMRHDLEYDQILYLHERFPAVVRTDMPLREERNDFLLEDEKVKVQIAETPFIIPPSHFKNFPQTGLPGLLWSCAYKALTRASHITIIGYSLPVTDYLPRWLLRIGLLFNEHSGEKLIRLYMGYPEDENLRYALGVQDITHHVTELRMMAMFHGDQYIRECWDRACIDVDVVNPDPQAENHFKKMVGVNVNYINATAGRHYGN